MRKPTIKTNRPRCTCKPNNPDKPVLTHHEHCAISIYRALTEAHQYIDQELNEINATRTANRQILNRLDKLELMIKRLHDTVAHIPLVRQNNAENISRTNKTKA